MIKNAKLTVDMVNECLKNGYSPQDLINFFDTMDKRKTAPRYCALITDIVNNEMKDAKTYAQNFKVSYQQINKDFEYCFRFLGFYNSFKIKHGINYNRELHQKWR